ncbi:T9SS type A sorting domain-containing protein [Fibrobacterota bacterium]
MKKPVLHPSIITVLSCFFLLTPSKSDAQWNCIGLENDTVLCIAKDKVFEDAIIVGTKSSGIKIYKESTWYDISTTTLPINDLYVTESATFIAAIGAGSNSDGIYLARAVWSGPPFYELGSMPFHGMMFPQALAGTEKGDTVFMGCATEIVSGISANPGMGNYDTFTTIKLPPHAFGVEKPRCAALQYHNWGISELYAGGYDESPEPGPGHLLWAASSGDSMRINSQLNITSLAEISEGPGNIFLYAGTKDTGIFFRSPEMSMPVAKFAPSPKNEPVNDMMILTDSVKSNSALFVAVTSGVFVYNSGMWFEIDIIPEEPLCITGYVTSKERTQCRLYAGTRKGVYEIDYTGLSINSQKPYTFVNTISIRHHTGRSMLITFTLRKPEYLSINLYNSSGKRVARVIDDYFSAGTHTIPVNAAGMNNWILSNGVYFCRLSTGENNVNKKFLLVR